MLILTLSAKTIFALGIGGIGMDTKAEELGKSSQGSYSVMFNPKYKARVFLFRRIGE